LANDTLGDGSVAEHSWAVINGESQPDGSVIAIGDYGTLIVEPDGTFTYTPTGDGGGVDTFTYTLAGADGDLSQATLCVEVAHTIVDPMASDGLPETVPLFEQVASPASSPEEPALAAIGAASDGEDIPDTLEPDQPEAAGTLSSTDALDDRADDGIEALLPPLGAGPEPTDAAAQAAAEPQDSADGSTDLTILGMELDSGSASPLEIIDELNKNRGDATKDG